MNLLGKLLIVLILIGSIIFMSFAVVLYATHTNWKNRADNLQAQFTAKEGELKKLQAAKDTMQAALTLESQRLIAREKELIETVRQLTSDKNSAEGKKNELEDELEIQNKAMLDSQEETDRLRVRLDAVTKAMFDAQNEWVTMSTELTKKIDEVNSLAVQYTSFKARTDQLAKDYVDAMEVLRIHGLSDDPALYNSRPPAGISGNVTEVRPKGFVEISVGSDSGLIKGHQLDVVRNLEGRSSYIGKIVITDTSPDSAVARVMPEFRRGVVQRDDKVTYIEVNELSFQTTK